MGQYRVRGYASLKIGDKEYKDGDVVELDDETAAHFKLPAAEQPAAPPVHDPVAGSRAPKPKTAPGSGPDRAAGTRVGETHTAPPVDRTRETPGQTAQGPTEAPQAAAKASTEAEEASDGDEGSSRRKRAR